MTTSRFVQCLGATGVAGLLGAASWLGPVQARAQGSAQERALSARIQRLEDIDEIKTVLLNYGRYLDARDFGGYSRLFAKDGKWVGGFGTVEGPAAIQAFMEKNIPGPNKGNTYHLLSNFVIDVHGDTATAWSRWAYVIPGADGKPAIAQGGHYDDTLVRENGHWKFQRRVAPVDIPPLDPVKGK
ncbi:MAG TPA: nuclear transport factor 2 family protein [Bryobacteraceae bacterium]|jgi:ketosteroid isomerase-like protein|nr:nuclear transport factor 2 family protein [Bryobacteraceae bacterium]